MNELNERMVLIFSYDPDCSTILKFDPGDRHVERHGNAPHF